MVFMGSFEFFETLNISLSSFSVKTELGRFYSKVNKHSSEVQRWRAQSPSECVCLTHVLSLFVT